MTPSQGSFSRSRTRIHFSAPVTLLAGDSAPAGGVVCDLSMNGAFVLTARPLPLGAAADFSIHLSAGMRKETVRGRCQVVRVEPVDDGLSAENPGPGMGIKFLEFAEDCGELLYQIIRHNAG